MDNNSFAFISGNGSFEFNEAVLVRLNSLAGATFDFLHLDSDYFGDGGPDFCIPQYGSLQDRHVVIFQSMTDLELKDEFLALVWAARNQYGAQSVIGVLPFFMHRREEHPEKLEEINRSQFFANQLAAAGANQVIFCDIHSQQVVVDFEAEGIAAIDVDSAPILAEQIMPLVTLARANDVSVAVDSPDQGSLPRAISLARALGAPVALGLKLRSETGAIKLSSSDAALDEIRGDYPDIEFLNDSSLKGFLMIMRDDEVSSGATSQKRAAHLLDDAHVKEVVLCGTHAVLTPGWRRKFARPGINRFARIFLANTIHRSYRKQTGGIITPVDVSSGVAKALYLMLAKL